MRTPSELMRLLEQYESTNDFETFAKNLSYEEVVMIIMTMEFIMRNPSLTSLKIETFQQALEFFKKIKKDHIERN